MKRILSLIALGIFFLVNNCGAIIVNNDPILGIWSKTKQTIINKNPRITERVEWIFNDAYLGRFHKYNGNTLEIKTDFRWIREDSEYTISYPGTNMKDDVVSINENLDKIVLVENSGNVLAVKE